MVVIVREVSPPSPLNSGIDRQFAQEFIFLLGRMIQKNKKHAPSKCQNIWEVGKLQLSGGFKYFLFTPNLEEDSNFE